MAAGEGLLRWLRSGGGGTVDRILLKPAVRMTASEQDLRSGLARLIASQDEGGDSLGQMAALEALRGRPYTPEEWEAYRQTIGAAEVEGAAPGQAAALVEAQRLIADADEAALRRAYWELPVTGDQGLTPTGTAVRQFAVPAAGGTAALLGLGAGGAAVLSALAELAGPEVVEEVLEEEAQRQALGQAQAGA